MNEVQRILAAITQGPSTSGVLCTLVQVNGSSYRRPGARLWIAADGTRVGSISGGCLEEDLVGRARRARPPDQPEVVTYDTTAENDLIWGVGTGCHGVVHILLESLVETPSWITTLAANIRLRQPTALAATWAATADGRLGTRLADASATAPIEGIFTEIIQPPQSLVIFGAGDDARPLVHFAKELGWEVTIADARPSFCAPERFPGADRVQIVDYETDLIRQGLLLDARTAVVIMTHHYVHDRPLLHQLLGLPLAYLGLLGPRKRTEKILNDLAVAHPSTILGQRLHSPVGLDLGGDSPAEVALSILAEIQAHLSDRDGRSLGSRTGSIHGS